MADNLGKLEIHRAGLLGELEALKARLWVRLTEFQELEPVVVLAKTAKHRRFPVSGNPSLTVLNYVCVR